MAGRKGKPQEQRKHPEPWEKDLNPEQLQGQNIGPTAGMHRRTAADVKELSQRLAEFGRHELEQIPLVPAGERLKQGAVYLDLGHPSPEPFTAMGEMTSQESHLYAPKADVPYEIWNRLVATLCPSAPEVAPAGAPRKEHFVGSNTVSEELLDKTIADSFPSSDPPSWTTGRDRSHRDDEQSKHEKEGHKD